MLTENEEKDSLSKWGFEETLSHFCRSSPPLRIEGLFASLQPRVSLDTSRHVLRAFLTQCLVELRPRLRARSGPWESISAGMHVQEQATGSAGIALFGAPFQLKGPCLPPCTPYTQRLISKTCDPEPRVFILYENITRLSV